MGSCYHRILVRRQKWTLSLVWLIYRLKQHKKLGFSFANKIAAFLGSKLPYVSDTKERIFHTKQHTNTPSLRFIISILIFYSNTNSISELLVV